MTLKFVTLNSYDRKKAFIFNIIRGTESNNVPHLKANLYNLDNYDNIVRCGYFERCLNHKPSEDEI